MKKELGARPPKPSAFNAYGSNESNNSQIRVSAWNKKGKRLGPFRRLSQECEF